MATSAPLRASVILAFGACLFANASAFAEISFLNPALSLGRLSPDSATVTPAAALIASDGPWRVSMTLDREKQRCGTAMDTGCRDRLELLAPSGEWVTLQPEIPVLVGSGEATDPAGAAHTFEFRFTIPWESPPGMRAGVIRCAITGAPAVALRYDYEVEPKVLLVPDERPFKSPAVNPAVEDLYAYEPRQFTVLSNVPWVVEVSIRERLKREGSSTTLSGDPLRVISLAGTAELLSPGRPPIVVAAGPATGASPAVFVIRLAAQTSRAGVVGGAYKTDLNIEARPRTSSP